MEDNKIIELYFDRDDASYASVIRIAFYFVGFASSERPRI